MTWTSVNSTLDTATLDGWTITRRYTGTEVYRRKEYIYTATKDLAMKTATDWEKMKKILFQTTQTTMF